MVPDHQLLLVIGLHGGGELREIIREMFDNTKDKVSTRSMSTFLNAVKKEYGKIAEINRLEKMEMAMQSKRKSDWDMKNIGGGITEW